MARCRARARPGRAPAGIAGGRGTPLPKAGLEDPDARDYLAGVDPLVRRGLRPRRLLMSAAIGVIVAIAVIALAGAAGGRILLYVAIPAGVIAIAGWVFSVLYLRTEGGQRKVQEYLAKRESQRRPR